MLKPENNFEESVFLFRPVGSMPGSRLLCMPGRPFSLRGWLLLCECSQAQSSTGGYWGNQLGNQDLGKGVRLYAHCHGPGPVPHTMTNVREHLLFYVPW